MLCLGDESTDPCVKQGAAMGSVGCVLLTHVVKRGYQEARELLTTPSLLPSQGLKVGLQDLGSLFQPK